MIKTLEVVIDALEDLVVQADEGKIEQSEGRAAIRALNDMMAMWDATGISLGYTQVSDLADEITCPVGSIVGIKANLALALAPKYDVQPDPALLLKARKGLDACLDLSIENSTMVYPETLPVGSGNGYPDYRSYAFYPAPGTTILTETGGSIALEKDTEEE